MNADDRPDNTKPPADERIIDHYEDPFHREPVEHATHLAEGDNPVCGDTIRIELRLTAKGNVAQAGFDGEGCVISQAAASMLMEQIVGLDAEQLDAFAASDMLELFAAPLAVDRRRCCLLPWRILQTARQSPVDSEDEYGDPNFGGPSLSEEC